MQSPAPSEYFPGIKFNYSFYTTGDTNVTLEYVNNNFLKCTGYAYSRAISTTFNGILYALGGINTTNINASGTITANLFIGSGAQLTTLNASTITDGTLPVARGGTGSNTLVSGQLLIGNGLNPLTQTSGLTWSSNTLTAANLTTGALITTDQVSTNFTTTFMSGYKNIGYQLYFQNICSSANFIKSDGTDTSTIKTVNTIYGIYQLTATSVNATNSKIENIFDDNPATYWTTSAATYTRLSLEANYSANSTYSVNVTNLGILYGESIKIRFPRKVYFKDVLYTPFSISTSITEGYILGSTNGSTWDPVYPINKFLTNLNEVSLVPTGTLPSIYTTTTKAYQYFMFITTSIQGMTGYPVNSTDKCAITNLRLILYDNWVYHDNIIAIGNTPNGSFISNALDVNGTAYISGKISTDGGISVLNGKLDVSGNIDAKSYTVNGIQFNSSKWSYGAVSTNIYYNGGNVGIGATTTSDVDDNTVFSIPTAVLYVKGGATTGGTCDVVIRGGVAGQNNGKARLWLAADASHSSYIESEHTGSGNTQLTFGTANGNALPAERMRIGNNGNVSIGSTDTGTYKLNVNGNSYFNGVLNHNTQYYGGGADFACNKFNLWGTGGYYGFGISGGTLDYFANTTHRFLWGSSGTSLGTVGMTLQNNNLTVVGGFNTGSCVASSYMISFDQVVGRGGGYDAALRCNSNGMYIYLSSTSTQNGDYLTISADGGNTNINSGYSRPIVMRTAGYGWLYTGASSYNPANSSYWNTVSDHRIKENIKKANIKTCYENVKNINLYRFNYIKAVGNATQYDRTQLGFVAQQVQQHFPKSVQRGKRRLEDKREIPDLANVDVNQVNFSLFGAVKQLIRVVEKQSKRIKKLEEMLNIIDDDEVEDDTDEPYIKIECDEVDIDTIEPSEPEGV